MSVKYTFAQDGEYDIQFYLARGYSGDIDGLRGTERHEIRLLLDRKPIGTMTVQRPPDGDDSLLDRNLKVRVPVAAGPHELAVTFLRNSSSLLETARQPLQAHFNERRHPRITPAIQQVSITGPYSAKGGGDTPSRRRIFVCRPAEPSQEDACARQILSTLMRRAFRRPIADADLERPLAFYREGKTGGSFDAGIERAVSAVLFNPEFLLRVETDPAGCEDRHALPRQRSRAGVAPVVLPLEQHSGRRAARRGHSRRAAAAGRAREAGAPDARRSALVQLRQQFRRAMAPAAESGVGEPESARCIRTSTTTSGRRSGRKPSSSWTACCARIAACST